MIRFVFSTTNLHIYRYLYNNIANRYINSKQILKLDTIPIAIILYVDC